MINVLKIFQKNSDKCEHDWVMDEPDIESGFGGVYVFKEWIGPVYDTCKKCGKRRLHPERKHRWKSAEDDGQGLIVNGVKLIRTKICKKCGTSLYEAPK